MLELYKTSNSNLHAKIKILLARKLKSFEISVSPSGKPYIKGNPLYFSLSHSLNRAVIALSDKPVGIDLECYACKNHKKFESILKRLSGRERQWIDGNSASFFINWVCKEAYIKMLGATLAQYLKRLEYTGDALYCDNREVNCGYAVLPFRERGTCAVCAEGYTNEAIADCKIKLFRLRKGEQL